MIRFNPAALRIFKISVLMMLCCHWMGCTWWLVSELEIQADDGEGARARRLDKAMLEAQNDWQPPTDLLNDDSLGPQYWRAFFWGAGMVTGFVPYDIEPVTEVEVLTTVVCMFLGVMINAVVIGSFTSALSSMDSKKEMCREKLETIGQYLIVHNVSSHLRNSILEYYEYLLTSSQSMELRRRPCPMLGGGHGRQLVACHERHPGRCQLRLQLPHAVLDGRRGRRLLRLSPRRPRRERRCTPWEEPSRRQRPRQEGLRVRVRVNAIYREVSSLAA